MVRIQEMCSDLSLFNLEGIPLRKVEIGYGGLAQLGERLPCKQEVSGSIPLISTIQLEISGETKYTGQ